MEYMFILSFIVPWNFISSLLVLDVELNAEPDAVLDADVELNAEPDAGSDAGSDAEADAEADSNDVGFSRALI